MISLYIENQAIVTECCDKCRCGGIPKYKLLSREEGKDWIHQIHCDECAQSVEGTKIFEITLDWNRLQRRFK